VIGCERSLGAICGNRPHFAYLTVEIVTLRRGRAGRQVAGLSDLSRIAQTVMESGWSLRAWKSGRSRKRVVAPAGAVSPAIYSDGFGTRWLAVDAESGDTVEILSFASQFAESPEFAAAVGERVARLARVRHTLYARVRRLDRPADNALLLFSDRVAGWRLADALAQIERDKQPLDISAVLALLRQLIPAVALFSRHQRDAAIGTISPERLVLTPQGRLVVAEYVLAPGLQAVHLSREAMWRDVRVTLPHEASSTRIPPSADVVGIGVTALSLVLGRVLRNDEFLHSLHDLLDEATEHHGTESRKLSAGFHQWIGRALQFDEKTAFHTPQEAQVAFEEMLAKERAYVTTQTQLDLFIARLEKAVGPPPAVPVAPPPVTPPAEPLAVPSAPRLVAPVTAAVVAESETAVPEAPAAAPKIVALPRPVALEPTPAPIAPAPATPVSAAAGPLERVKGYLLPALAALVVLQAAAIGWLWTHRPVVTAGAEGELVIQSRPLAARVSIDGDDRGVTPFTTNLGAGAHIVEVRVGRAEPRVIPVEIKGGVQNSLYVELQSVATVGGVDVRSDPGRARVTIDGRYRGDTPLVLRDLAPGDHEVLLESGKQKVKQTLHVEPGLTSQLVVPLR
jgi:hypothetical protein